MSFTSKDVQMLRERTGCGMMDCKKALTEADGDMEKAIEYLREKGLAAAAKKAGRIAAEGLVAAIVDDKIRAGAIIEVNSETDFVAKNESFAAFAEACARTVIESAPADVGELLALKMAGSDRTVEENLRDKILTIGENLKIRRFTRYEGEVVAYIHGGGRIGVMVSFDVDAATAGKPQFKEYAKDVAMQVAAYNPMYLSRDMVPEEVLAKEREILTAQAINEGKPEQIAAKMVEGRLVKYYKENCLLEQVFIKDPDMTVEKYTAKITGELGGNIKIKSYVRYEKGEGLEKKEDNFADEVANMNKK